MLNSEISPVKDISEFDTTDKNYPHNILNREGAIKEEVKELLNTLPKDKAVILSLAICTKLRNTEYNGSTITKNKVHLQHPRKGSKAIRDLAKIEPFYSFLIANRGLLSEALNKYCVGDKTTYNFFVKHFGGGARTLERATITFLEYQGINGGSKVAGHINPNNTKIYSRSPDYSVDTVKEKLKGNPELLIMFNGLLSAFNRTIERLETRIEQLEG
jgi:hypothetical protein